MRMKYTNPILMCDFCNGQLGESTATHTSKQLGQTSYITKFVAHFGAIEIAAQGDVVIAHDLAHVQHVIGQSIERHVGATLSITSQIAGVKIDTDDTTRIGNDSQLFVGQVASALAQGVAATMRCDKWFGRDVGGVHEAPKIHV